MEEFKAILTLEDLAKRWSVPIENLRRRVNKMKLAAVNVGTVKKCDGTGDRSNCADHDGSAPGLEGYDPYDPKHRFKGITRK